MTTTTNLQKTAKTLCTSALLAAALCIAGLGATSAEAKKPVEFCGGAELDCAITIGGVTVWGTRSVIDR